MNKINLAKLALALVAAATALTVVGCSGNAGDDPAVANKPIETPGDVKPGRKADPAAFKSID